MDWSAITAWLDKLSGPWQVVVHLAIWVVVLFIINRILQAVISALARRRDPVASIWAHAFLVALGPPLRVVIWIVGLTVVAARLLAGHDLFGLASRIPAIRSVLIILTITWFLFRVVRFVENNIHARAEQRDNVIDATAADAIGKLVRAMVLIAAVLAVMQALRYPLTSLLAFGGAAGIAVGFAAQSLVANFFGGLTIFATRMFRIGEDIILPGTTLSGTVEHIGWRATRVRGWDGKPFYVPNAQFNTVSVINHTRMSYRRVMEYIYLRQEDLDKVEAIVAKGNDAVGAHPEMDHSFWVFRFDSFGDYAVKLFLYAYADTTSYGEYMRIKEDLLLKLTAIVHEQGAQLAVPVSSVRTPQGLRLLKGPGPDKEPAIQGLQDPQRDAPA